MRILAFSALALGLGLTFVQVTACSNSADDCNATATCGATAGATHAGSAGKSGGGDGSGGGADNGGTSNVAGASTDAGSGGATGSGGEGGGGPTSCTGDVSDDAACWATNDLGVFVSSDAADENGDGTKEAPFKTIAKGIAAAAGKNVYVCVGASDYSEKVSLDVSSDGIHIYGGFECANWTYATTRSAQVLSPSNIALRIDGLKKGAHIENVSFQAADATGTGPDASSYGAFVTGSKGVALTRVELKAGKGAKGADGVAGITGENAAEPGASQNGSAPACDGTVEDGNGGLWSAVVCGSRGGKGGGTVLNTAGANGFSGTPAQNVTPANKINLGVGTTGDNVPGVDGTPGADGNAGVPATAAPEAGAFAVTGFAPAAGIDGGSGFPGQGGGGGGASGGNSQCRGAGGGAGGMGGCGGGPGKGGGGGGASVGAFAWSSVVTLVGCRIQSVAGGAGGKGGAGGVPGTGGEGGLGGSADLAHKIGKGAHGGAGGNGGPGANGSGGTGGPSYALVYADPPPTYDAADTTLLHGTPGAAGMGGEGLATKAVNGSVGLAADDFAVP